MNCTALIFCKSICIIKFFFCIWKIKIYAESTAGHYGLRCCVLTLLKFLLDRRIPVNVSMRNEFCCLHPD